VPVSSERLAEIIGDRPTAMNRGGAGHTLTLASTPGREGAPAAAVFLKKFFEQPVPDGNVGQHPANAVKMDADDMRRLDSGGKAEPLSDTERAWLEHLPKDPAAVTFEDAPALAALAQRFSPATQPAEARHVNTFWQPVSDLHERRILKNTIALASRPLPDVPRDEALGALIEAVRAERPKGTPDYEIRAHALHLLNGALERREQDRLTRKAQAQAQLDRLNAKAAKRKELVR
jgi:hypothetical protein